jgi:hypothetical protein
MGATNPSIGNVTGAGSALMGFGEDLSGMFNETFPGIYQSLIEQSRIDPEQYVGKAAADTTDAFAGALETQRRSATRMGVNPNSGRFAALEQNWARAMAATKSGAMTDARFKANDTKFARTQAAANVGLNLGQMATGAMSSAAGAFGTAGSLENSLNGQNFDIQFAQNKQDGYDQEQQKRLNLGSNKNAIT